MYVYTSKYSYTDIHIYTYACIYIYLYTHVKVHIHRACCQCVLACFSDKMEQSCVIDVHYVPITISHT